MDVHTLIDGPHNLIPTSAGCIGLLIVISYVFNTYFSKTSRLRRRLPPGPKPKPLIGNILDMPPPGKEVSPHWINLGKEHGPIMSFNLMGQSLIIVNKLEIAKELLEKRSSKYSMRPTFQFAGELAGYKRGIIFQQPNDKFRQMRKLTHTHIGSPMVLRKWDSQIDLETRRYLLRVLEKPADFFQHIRGEAASIILKVVYGYQTEPNGSDRLIDLIETVMKDFSEACVAGKWLVDIVPWLKYVPEWMPGADFKRTARTFYDRLTVCLNLPFDFVENQMKAGTERPSIVSGALETTKDNKPLSGEQQELIKQIAMALYGGGADTTVATMQVFFLAMLKFPHVLRKAQEEIDQVLGASHLPGPDDKARLPYCEAVVKESLRWNPIGEMLMPHVVSEDDEYNGYFIPKGSMVIANFIGFCKDPEIYSDPDVFKPERFLGDKPELDPLVFTWGFGKRICPGRFLAYSNLWLEMSRTIACFNINPVNGKVPSGEFTVGFLRAPVPFEADITVRSPEWEQLIREVETTDPMPDKGDGQFLSREMTI